MKLMALIATFFALYSIAFPAYAEVSVAKGKEIFHAYGKPKYLGQVIGNCTACHLVDAKELQGEDQSGNIGPMLIGMKERYPDKKKLFAKIWNPTQADPNSIMPMYGAHGMMSKEDVQSLVEYVYGL